MKKITDYSMRCAALALAASLAACAGSPTRESPGQFIDSAVISSKLNAKLLGDSLTSALQVEVDTFKDVVQLSGFVDSEAEKARAGELAREVEGVGRLQNDLIVKTSNATAGEYLDDSVITARVKSALLRDAGTRSLQVEVKTYRGTVQLSGFVDNNDLRSKAGAVARAVDGVAVVYNDLIIKPG